MDSDYYQVPVGAASEGGRVLQTVSQSRLQLPAPGYSCWRGDGHEAVGIQREARHVHVPGQLTAAQQGCSHIALYYFVYLQIHSTNTDMLVRHVNIYRVPTF